MFHVIFCHPKFESNVGSLARTVDLFGAQRIIIANHNRVKNIHPATDTAKVLKKRGEFYPTLAEALKTFEKKYSIIGVELSEDSHDLTVFNHPENAVYVYGAEDVGLTEEEKALCDDIITIPSIHNWSFNVSHAAAIVSYDRYTKNISNTTNKQQSPGQMKLFT